MQNLARSAGRVRHSAILSRVSGITTLGVCCGKTDQPGSVSRNTSSLARSVTSTSMFCPLRLRTEACSDVAKPAASSGEADVVEVRRSATLIMDAL